MVFCFYKHHTREDMAGRVLCENKIYLIEDTYIEQQFHDECKKHSFGEKLWSDWLYNKYQYIGRTKTTIYEFMNYSMHDETHSINILKSIERILGIERVNKLSLGDLWLLLNVAYSHDIGMSADYEDLYSLWKDKGFLNYLNKARWSFDKDTKNAANHYSYLDYFIKKHCGEDVDTLDNDFSFNWEDLETWPLEFRKEITNLMSSYIRMKHGEFGERYFIKSDTSSNIVQNKRLYDLLGQISALHTEEVDKIKELYNICNGFGEDNVHPQFIAILLRIGDLLDLDNNRFDIFSIRHFGKLPRMSVAHYKKHKSITHLLVNTTVIEVTAQSDDFEVCKLNLIWFNWLKREIEYMTTHWREMAPSDLQGCLMGLPVLEVYHKKDKFKSDFVRDFELNKRKLLDLFMGNNLYDTELDSIREFIQNAIDATRFQLWYELDINIKKHFFMKNKEVKMERLKPIDLTKEAYDNFPIYIYIKECIDASNKLCENKFILEICDVGIGIDEEGINSISHIGSGWRERSNYTEVIRNMKQWFRPTGGFGIGLQSAFMLTDKVELYTLSAYNTGYKITLSEEGEPNDILVEYDVGILNQGTRIRLEIEFNKMNKNKILKRYGDIFNGDFFDYEDKLKNVYKIIKKYIGKQFPNSLFPIIVQLKKGKKIQIEERIQSQYFFKEMGKRSVVPDYINHISIWNGRTDNKSETDLDKEKELIKAFYRQLEVQKIPCDKLYVSFEWDNCILRIWDDVAEVFYYIKLSSSDTAALSANYKNVAVLQNSSSIKEGDKEQWLKSPYLTNVLFDVMGMKVEECLLVTRNCFIADAFKDKIKIEKFVMAYFHILLKSLDYNNTIKRDRLLDIMMLNNTVIDVEKHQELISDWQSGGLWVWSCEYIAEDGAFRMRKSYYLYDQIFAGLAKDSLIIAIPEAVGQANIFLVMNRIIEFETAVIEFCNHLLIIDDAKTVAVLRHYCTEAGRTIIRLNKTKEDDEKVNFNAIRLINDNNPIIIKLKEQLQVLEGNSKADQVELHDEKNIKIKRFIRYCEEVRDNDVMQEVLLVNRIPFKESNSGLYYIISPYSNTIGAKINQRTNRDSTTDGISDGQLSQQEFVDIVMEDETFSSLCRWVYDHQKYLHRYSIKQIGEAYRNYIIKDYEKNF